MPSMSVVLPAAGRSTRFGDKHEKKQFAMLEGRPLWLHAAEKFVNRQEVCQTLVVIPPEDQELFLAKFGSTAALMGIEIVLGGPERCDSVERALERVREDVDLVCIHDAARPCVASSWIDQVVATAAEKGAAILATPVAQTLKRVSDDGRIEETISRAGLWEAQTPQVFRRDWIVDAYRKRGDLLATDDAQLVERVGYPVYVVMGSQLNTKVTTKEDLRLAEQILKILPKPASSGPMHPFAEDHFWR
jgi:2-C-methyl-D-erythritol 4-phosphate cytidylyltransferase